MRDVPGDGLAWYRHTWPWFVFGLLGVSIAGSLVTVFLAYADRDPLVGEEWYAEGVAINEDLERLEAARRAGIRARVEFASEPDRVNVAMTGEGVDDVERLDFVLHHATRAEFDRSVTLVRVAPGLYEAAFPQLARGRFYATLQPSRGEARPDPNPAVRWKLSRAFRSDASSTLLLGGEG